MSFLISLFRLCAAAFSELARSTFPQPQRIPARLVATRKAPGKKWRK